MSDTKTSRPRVTFSAISDPDLSASSLRPFTQDDWHGYAGCETDSPEIAELMWGDVILDGCTVGAHPHRRDPDEAWMTTFEGKPDLARLVAEAVIEAGEAGLAAFLEQVN